MKVHEKEEREREREREREYIYIEKKESESELGGSTWIEATLYEGLQACSAC